MTVVVVVAGAVQSLNHLAHFTLAQLLGISFALHQSLFVLFFRIPEGLALRDGFVSHLALVGQESSFDVP